jgi:hypothetical protein
MPAIDLLTYIFTNTRLPLAVQFDAWVQQSPRFRAWAEMHRDKIRKKVRVVTEPEGYRDLEAELATAYSLVQERRFLVEYEKYGLGKQRGPDFSVTYKTHVRFDVEVARVRGTRPGAALDPVKLAGTILVKLPQLPPAMINVLVIAAGDAAMTGEDNPATALRAALSLLQQRAERKDDDYFTHRGFLGVRDFHRRYARLSAIRMVTPAGPPTLLLNPQAKHQLPPDLANILRR